MLQWSKTHAVDRPLKMHKIAFIFVVPDIALLTPRMQKSFKIVENSSQNDAAERTYTQGSVAFGPFLGGPKIENHMIRNPKASQGSRFFRGRCKK